MFYFFFWTNVSRVPDASVAGTTHSGNEREHVFGTNLSILLPGLRLGVPGEICSWGHDLKFKLGQGCFFFPFRQVARLDVPG